MDPGDIRELLLAMQFPEAMIDEALRRHSTIESCVGWISAQAKEEPAKRPLDEFECPLCFCDSPLDEQYGLNCGHRFCKSCLQNYVHSKIDSKQVKPEEFVCPIPGCVWEPTEGEAKYNITKEVSPQIVEAVADADHLERYQRHKLDIMAESRPNMMQCPRCPNYLFLPRPPDPILHCVTCPNMECGHKFCGECGDKPHHKPEYDDDVSCEQYAVWKAQNDDAAKLMELYLKNHGQTCPSCKEAVQRESGCKFLYCKCSTKLCAMCGRKLDEKQHYSHFKDGPFGNKCYGGAKDNQGHVAEPACQDCEGNEISNDGEDGMHTRRCTICNI